MKSLQGPSEPVPRVGRISYGRDLRERKRELVRHSVCTGMDYGLLEEVGGRG